MNFLMIAIFFQWQLWKYEAEHQERVVRLSLPGPAPHIQVIPPCLTLSPMVPQVFSASGKDHEEGGERWKMETVLREESGDDSLVSNTIYLQRCQNVRVKESKEQWVQIS